MAQREVRGEARGIQITQINNQIKSREALIEHLMPSTINISVRQGHFETYYNRVECNIRRGPALFTEMISWLSEYSFRLVMC